MAFAVKNLQNPLLCRTRGSAKLLDWFHKSGYNSPETGAERCANWSHRRFYQPGAVGGGDERWPTSSARTKLTCS